MRQLLRNNNNNVATLFVSDLHLDPDRSDATATFIRFLDGPARDADRLYILGDLFEVWIGDDDPNPAYAEVRDALARFTSAGNKCFFMPGNRDFLIGPRFITSAGLILLPDPTLIEVAGTSVLLSHGDALCTDDHAYQRFRRISRNAFLLRLYHALPFALRNWLADTARTRSKTAKQDKSAAIMDVNQGAVESMLRHFGMLTLLHGHTHRPDEHSFEINGQAATRIVLGDWYESGPVLTWDETGRRTEHLEVKN